MKLSSAVLISILFGPAVPALAQAPDTAQATSAAQRAARSWLALLDGAHYGATWDSAASYFRGAVTKSAWEEAARKARGPFEPFGTRKLLGASFQTRLPNAPPGEYVVLQYQTKTRGEKLAVETITPMREKDGTWRVSGYYIRPE
jgi:hypothetical protein